MTHDPEVARNLANRFRTFFTYQPRLTVREEGISVNLRAQGNDTTYRFPRAGIHWESVVVLNHKGDFSRVPFGPFTWQPRLKFKQPQDTPLVIKTYTRCKAVIITSAEDFPGDFEQSFTPVEDFFPPTVLVPLLFLDRGRVDYRGDSDLYTLSGSLACYGARGPRGIEDLLSVTDLVQEILSTDGPGLRTHGILSLTPGERGITEFPGFVEAVIPFSAVIVLNAQEDHYWNIPY